MEWLYRFAVPLMFVLGFGYSATEAGAASTYAEVSIRGDLGKQTSTGQIIAAIDDAEKRGASYVILTIDSASGTESDVRGVTEAIGRLKHARAVAWVRKVSGETSRIAGACAYWFSYGDFYDARSGPDSPFVVHSSARNYGQLRQLLGVTNWDKLPPQTRSRPVLLKVVEDPVITERDRRRAEEAAEAERLRAIRIVEHERLYGQEQRDVAAKMAILTGRVAANERSVLTAKQDIEAKLRTLEWDLAKERLAAIEKRLPLESLREAEQKYNQSRLAAVGAQEALVRTLQNDSDRAQEEWGVLSQRLWGLRFRE